MLNASIILSTALKFKCKLNSLYFLDFQLLKTVVQKQINSQSKQWMD